MTIVCILFLITHGFRIGLGSISVNGVFKFGKVGTHALIFPPPPKKKNDDVFVEEKKEN